MDKLNLMQSFIAVAEQGTYTAAARRLGKTKALLSTHISQLETALDVRLITRSTRSLTLTATGKAYYEQAKKLLDELATLESSLKHQQQQLAGRLRISAPTTYGEQVLMPLVARFIKHHPQLSVDVLLNDRYVDLVAEGFDLAVRVGQLPDSNLVARPVTEVKICVYATPSFIERYGRPQTPQQLMTLPCVVDSNNRQYGKWPFADGLQVKVNPVAVVNSALAACKLALCGDVLAMLPDFAVADEVVAGRLLPVLEAYAPPPLPVHVVYPHRQHLSARVSIFLEAFRQYVTADRQ